MKFLKSLLTNRIFFILAIICLLSFSLNLYKKTSVPACLNADEAAFGYNAYSILKTGADEYGTKLPLRLKSFGDYKMPLYSYLSAPFIWLSGLNDISPRLLNSAVAFFFPVVIYFLTKELFQKKKIALLSSLLTATSIALHIVGRQAHEAYIAAFLVGITSLYFLRMLKRPDIINSSVFLISLLISLFAYQSNRIFLIFFMIYSAIYFFRKRIKPAIFAGLLIVIFLFGITDFIYTPERVKNLFFLNNRGFHEKVLELRIEGGNKLLYNKFTVGVKEVLSKHIQYFSPQFLTLEGDTNRRFGFSGLSAITLIEYLLFIMGLYYLIKNGEKWKYYLLTMLVVSPLTASLTWVDPSLTRSLFTFVLILIIAAYGGVSLVKNSNKKYSLYLTCILALIWIVAIFYSWDFYFNHYSKRAVMVRNWQCGYKELADLIKHDYKKFDKFYITPKNGQPYIFLLHYLAYPPEKYQKQATLSPPDEYGFGQVEKFDKFIFKWPNSQNEKNAMYIGYPDDFQNSFNPKTMKKIKVGTEEIFWIYPVPR